MHYKPPDNLEKPLPRHQHVKDAKNVTKIDWQVEVIISDDYAQYCHKFIKMLYEFESVWNDQPIFVKEALQRIALALKETRPIQTVHYLARPKASELEKN